MKPAHRYRFTAPPFAVSAVLALACLSTFSGVLAAGANASPYTASAGNGSAPSLARPEFDSGIASPGLPMERMLLLLRPGNQEAQALDAYLAATEDRRSPNYHRWLTPSEFGMRFGASAANIAIVEAWLEGQGFTVAPVAQGRQWIEFSGNASQVEAAFHAEVHTYVVDGKQHYANATEARIPAELASMVSGVVSLNDFESAQQAPPRARGIPSASVDAADAVTPAQFASLYNLKPLYDAGITGSGQSIAVIARGAPLPTEVDPVRSLYAAPSNSPQILINGPILEPGSAPELGRDGRRSPTGDLDRLQATAAGTWAGAVAPAAAIRIIVSQSTYATDGADLSIAYAIDHVSARILSSSYFDCQGRAGSIHAQFLTAAFRQGAAEGITSIVAAPDPVTCEVAYGKVAATSAPEADQSSADRSPTDQASADLFETAVMGPAGWIQFAIGRGQDGLYLPGEPYDGGASASHLESPSALAGVFALVDQATDSAQGNVNPRLSALANVPGVFRNGTSSEARATCSGGDLDCGQGSFDGHLLATKWNSDDATAAATITLSTSSATPVYGGTFVATATLAAASAPAPTGTVQFTVDGAAQGTATISTGTGPPIATLSFYTPIVGTHNLDATYSGDATYAPATAPIVSIVVQHGASVTSIAAAPAVLTSSVPEVFTAVVSDKVTTDTPGTFTGNVQFFDGTTPLATPVLLASNTAVSSPVTLDPTVAHAITAVYYGDGNWTGSVSPQLTLLAGAGASATTLHVSSSDAIAGSVLTLTATVAGTATTAATAPTGLVTLLDGTQAIGQTALVDNLGVPTATFFTGNLAVGAHPLSAMYPGDANFTASTSSAVVVTIEGYTLASNVNNLTLSRGQSGSVTYTLASSAGLNAAVAFGCAAPPSSEMTCTFTPEAISGSGTAVLNITTTAPGAASSTSGSRSGPQALLLGWYSGGAVSLALLFAVPFTGRRCWLGADRYNCKTVTMLALLLVCLSGSIGCGTSSKVVTPPPDGGTPIGVQTLTISSAVTVNSVTTKQYSYISVNVQ